MSSVVIAGDTSGSVTLAAPAVSGTTTLTLPATTGTFLTTTSPKAGNVIQVVQGTTTTDVSVASTSYTDTTLSASITPSSSSNKILVIVSQSLFVQRGTNNGMYSSLNIVRGATQIVESERAVGIDAGTNASGNISHRGMASIQYLDSPSTTSSTTYKTQIKASTTANSGIVYAQQGGSPTTSIITLMEIAG